MAKKKKTAKKRKAVKSPVRRKSSDVFFVGLQEPIRVRRAILEGSRDLVTAMQSFDRFCAVRREKKELMETLKSLLTGITRGLNQLKHDLPEMPSVPEPRRVAAEPKKRVVEQRPRSTVSDPIKLKPQERSELRQLESELDDIERKLGEL